MLVIIIIGKYDHHMVESLLCMLVIIAIYEYDHMHVGHYNHR